mmetsp:Transcript_25314/g.56886  ORF Transcript_25314/g.56886 Transcript_25314/m.56886 type:complete len:328 (+) Transcript_25314:81-1064(+)
MSGSLNAQGRGRRGLNKTWFSRVMSPRSWAAVLSSWTRVANARRSPWHSSSALPTRTRASEISRSRSARVDAKARPSPSTAPARSLAWSNSFRSCLTACSASASLTAASSASATASSRSESNASNARRCFSRAFSLSSRLRRARRASSRHLSASPRADFCAPSAPSRRDATARAAPSARDAAWLAVSSLRLAFSSWSRRFDLFPSEALRASDLSRCSARRLPTCARASFNSDSDTWLAASALSARSLKVSASSSPRLAFSSRRRNSSRAPSRSDTEDLRACLSSVSFFFSDLASLFKASRSAACLACDAASASIKRSPSSERASATT